MMEDNRISEELGGNLSAGAPEATAVAEAPPETVGTADFTEWSEGKTVIEVPDLPPQKPKTKLPVALISVVAVILVIMIGAYASGVIANPERAILKALTATGEAMDRRAEQIASEIPLMDQSTDAETALPTKTTFSFTYDWLKSDDLPPEMALILNMIKGIGVQGSYSSDPAGMTEEIDGALVWNDFDLFSLYAFSSPEQLSVGLPSLMDTAYSINPKTFTADIQQSPLYAMLELTPADVAEAQESLDTLYGGDSALDDLDYKQMQKDIRAVFAKTVAHAEFKSTGRKDGMKQYTVSVPGEDVNTTLSALVRYVYLESAFKNVFKTAMEPTLAYEDMTYEEFIERMILDPLASLPKLPAVLTLNVDKTVKSARLEIIPELTSGTGVDVLDRIEADFVRADNGDLTMLITLDGRLSTEPFLMTVNVEETYAEGAYALNLGGEVKSTEANLFFEESVQLDKAGAVGLLLDMSFDDGIEIGQIGLDIGGTVKKDGNKTVCDFPKFEVKFNADSIGDYTVNFKLTADTEPVQTSIVPARPSKPVLAMSEEELYTDLMLLGEQIEALESAIYRTFGLDAFAGPYAMFPAA